MSSMKQCAICGAESSSAVEMMGQYICPFCQTLLDDPKRRRQEREESAR